MLDKKASYELVQRGFLKLARYFVTEVNLQYALGVRAGWQFTFEHAFLPKSENSSSPLQRL